MRWRRSAPPPLEQNEDVTVSEETARALAAAANADAELAALRRRAPRIAASGEQLAEENRHNGFYLLIRQALGSN